MDKGMVKIEIKVNSGNEYQHLGDRMKELIWGVESCKRDSSSVLLSTRKGIGVPWSEVIFNVAAQNRFTYRLLLTVTRSTETLPHDLWGMRADRWSTFEGQSFILRWYKQVVTLVLYGDLEGDDAFGKLKGQFLLKPWHRLRKIDTFGT